MRARVCVYVGVHPLECVRGYPSPFAVLMFT